MAIDIFPHVLPIKYKNRLYRDFDKFMSEKKIEEKRVTLANDEARLRILDAFEGVAQVLSVTLPPLEEVVSPQEAAELARLSNDEMVELVGTHPKKFIAAIANLPLNNMDAALKEAERTLKELGFKGVQIYTSIHGKPLSAEEWMPLYRIMVDFDLPIWIHPLRRSMVPDYPTEDSSFHQIFSIFGWPYETTAAMTRLVFAGIFEKFPKIKFITHHCSGMIPFFADRIFAHYNNGLERLGKKVFPGLTRPPIEYFKIFYGDTALNGDTSALMCGYHFFGEDHLLFGTDMPFDVENGALSIRETIKAIERMDILLSSKKKIYEGNAITLLRL
jgi:predicted TIM-barrel fold metal-dependent hydrolase